MGLLTPVRNFVLPDATIDEIVHEYRRLRKTKFQLNNMLVARLPKDVLEEGARKLGILRDGMLVFNTEDESSVLMDYCIYDVRRNGRNAIEQYLIDSPPPHGSDEGLCSHAMQHATYGLVVVLGVQSGTGCLIQNLYNDKQYVLIDMGLSQTAQPGLLLGTRLLDFGRYHTTGGAAVPFGVLTENQLDEWRQKLSDGVIDESADPAPLIRSALRSGASCSMRYANAEDVDSSNVQTATIRRGDPAGRKREMAKYLTSKTAANQRCRCGSGRMYKNCCMKQKPPEET